MFSGICKGGPLNGKPLHHSVERFFKFKRDGRIISYFWDGHSPLPDDIEVGAYEWDAEDKCWQWTREV
jgi:hypothetical protein